MRLLHGLQRELPFLRCFQAVDRPIIRVFPHISQVTINLLLIVGCGTMEAVDNGGSRKDNCVYITPPRVLRNSELGAGGCGCPTFRAAYPSPRDIIKENGYSCQGGTHIAMLGRINLHVDVIFALWRFWVYGLFCGSNVMWGFQLAPRCGFGFGRATVLGCGLAQFSLPLIRQCDLDGLSVWFQVIQDDIAQPSPLAKAGTRAAFRYFVGAN